MDHLLAKQVAEERNISREGIETGESRDSSIRRLSRSKCWVAPSGRFMLHHKY